MVYKRVQKKSSSSSPAYTNEASKSKFRQPSFGIQPQTDTDSSPQESPSYSQEPHEYRSTNFLSRTLANLQRQALVQAQLSQLEPEAQADEVSNEAVEIQHQNESAESGDEDSNSADGGTIQRSCSECQSEPEEEKTSSEPPQSHTIQRQSKYLHQKTPIQAKLTIGSPGDKYEQEADSMAARVMSMDAPTTNPQTIQRQSEEQHESIQQQPPVSPFVQRLGELVQRMAEVKASTDQTVVNSNKEPLFSGKQDNLESTQLEYLQAKHINRVNARPGTEATYLDNRSHTETSTAEESVIQPLTDETLQRSVQDDTTSATPSLESRLGSQTGGGSPLDEQTRSFMESGFGADFSQVKVHTDTTAVQMNKELGAQAFTHGHDVYFGEGKAPGKNELTAHELTHVVQQGGALRMNKEPLAAKKLTIQQAPEKFNQELRLNPLSNLWNRGNRFVKNAWRDPRKAASNATKYAKNAWNNTTKTASNLAGSATKYAKNAWNNTTKTVRNLTGSATKYAKNAWNNTTKTARNLTGKATKYAKNAWNNTTKTARNLTGKATKYAKNAWNKTTKTVRNLAGNGTKYAKNAWNKTTKTVRNLAGNGTKYAKDAWHNTTKTVRNLAGNGTKYAKDAWHNTTKTVRNLAGNGTKYAKDAWHNTTKTVRNLAGNGTKYAKDAWNNTTKTVRNLAGSGTKYAKDAWHNTTKTVRNLAGSGTKYAKDAWHNTTKTVQDLAGSTSKYATNAWNNSRKSPEKSIDQQLSSPSQSSVKPASENELLSVKAWNGFNNLTGNFVPNTASQAANLAQQGWNGFNNLTGNFVPKTVSQAANLTGNFGTDAGEQAQKYWAEQIAWGEQQEGLTGWATQAVGYTGGALSSLWTKDTAVPTAVTLGTAGLGPSLGAAAQAGKFGLLSKPILGLMKGGSALGTVGGAVSLEEAAKGVGIGGNQLETWERWQRAIVGGAGIYTGLHGLGVPLPNPNLGIPRNPFGSPGVTKNPNLRLPTAHDGDTVTMIEDPLNPGHHLPKLNTPTGGTSTPSSNKGGAIVNVRNTAVNTDLTVPSSSQSGAIASGGRFPVASIKALPPARETNITGGQIVPPHLRNLIPQINTPPTGTSTTSSSQSGAIKALPPARETNITGGQIVPPHLRNLIPQINTPPTGTSTTSSSQSGAIKALPPASETNNTGGQIVQVPPSPGMPEEFIQLRATLKEQQAIDFFDQKYTSIVRDPANPTQLESFRRLLNGVAKKSGGDLEQGLLKAAPRTNVKPVKPPYGEKVSELPRLRSEAEDLKVQIQKWIDTNPTIKGGERIIKRIDSDIKGILKNMENGHEQVTKERIQGFDNNLKGTVAEFEKAQTAEPGTEVSANIKVGDIDVEIDQISPDRTRWINIKNYKLFGVKDGRLPELIKQAKQNLLAAQANPVNGSPPQIVFDFSGGVTPEVAAELRAVNVNGQHLIVKGKEIPLSP